MLLLLVVSIIYIRPDRNTAIILLSYFNPKLHTPMFLPLQSLLPGPLFHHQQCCPTDALESQGLTRPLATLVCVIQLYVALGLGSAVCPADCYGLWPLQCYLSTPPLWSDHVHPKLLQQLAALAWISGSVGSMVQTILFSSCLSAAITWWMTSCVRPALIKIACVDTTFLENELSIASILYVLIPLGLILVSYGCIVRSVLRIKSTEGRRESIWDLWVPPNCCGFVSGL